MGQPVKVSDELLLDARLAADVLQRSIAGQIEFWARLGRAIEPLLAGERALALCRNGTVRPLSACLMNVDTAQGQKEVQQFLKAQPFPHYEAAHDRRGLLVRIDADGTRTLGRFVRRQFRPVKRKEK
jgi:hypothetical protein